MTVKKLIKELELYPQDYKESIQRSKNPGSWSMENRWSSKGCEGGTKRDENTTNQRQGATFLPYHHAIYESLRLVFEEYANACNKMKMLSKARAKAYEQGYSDGLNKAYHIINYEIGQGDKDIVRTEKECE